MTERDELRAAAQVVAGYLGRRPDHWWLAVPQSALRRLVDAALTAGQSGAGDGAGTDQASGGQKIIDGLNDIVAGRYTETTVFVDRNPAPHASPPHVSSPSKTLTISAASPAPAADLGVQTPETLRSKARALIEQSNTQDGRRFQVIEIVRVERPPIVFEDDFAPPDPPSIPEHECNTVRERPNARLVEVTTRLCEAVIAGTVHEPDLSGRGGCPICSALAEAALAAERGGAS